MWKFTLACLPLFSLLAQGESAPLSMLSQAEQIAQKFHMEVAKIPPPAKTPLPQNCLDAASIWFTIDLNEIAPPAFETLQSEALWDLLREIGVEGIYFKGLKQGGTFRTGISLDPKWGNGWNELALLLQKKTLAWIGDSIGSSTGLSADFWLALKNVADYPGLYHLVEIEKPDWKSLPNPAPSQFAANVPWLNLQELHKKGYVPEQYAPYVKNSQWNATRPIQCLDGVVRRWIYLKENKWDPVIDWLHPSFAGCRIAAADILDSILNLGMNIAKIDGRIRSNAQETLSLWARKLGAFSVLEVPGGLEEYRRASTDLIFDGLTRPALLHALIAEDAEALKLMYRLFLEAGIEIQRLVHVLQPLDAFACDWAELLCHPKKRFPYRDEMLTGEALRMRLLKEDVLRLGNLPPATWPKICSALCSAKEEALNFHLLLAFFYAMQPGAFSFSTSDLLGILTEQTVHLMQPNENTIYASLPGQMNNGRSFARRLKHILTVRKENNVESGELICIPETKQRGLIILIHRLRSGMTQLLAVNFGRTAAQQTLEMPNIRQTTAIDLMTGLAEKKPLESATLRLDLPPLSGKVILFQTKYYD